MIILVCLSVYRLGVKVNACSSHLRSLLFFFNDTATTEIYTYCHPLSLHDALPIWRRPGSRPRSMTHRRDPGLRRDDDKRLPQPRFEILDRKSTRLNSSH